MKRLILSTVCIMFCSTGLWARTLVDGIYYDFDASTQTASVSRQSSGSCSGDITIPSTVAYNGTSYSVTSIGRHAFYYCSGLTSITIPNSVTSIEYFAFGGCSGLTSVTIPNSVTSIGDRVFEYCSGLASITIPNGVTSIGEHAFYYCSGLTSITIPNSVTSIGERAFYNCSGLTSITIPNSVTSIEDYAFYGCSGLASVTIGEGVTSIGSMAFYNCSGLKEVINKSELDIEKGSIANGYVAYYADYVCNGGKTIIGDFIFSDQDKTLVKYTGDGGAITLPENFNGDNYTVGKNAFSGNSSLASVTIPNGVTNIESTTFEGCSGLTSINVVLGNSVYDSRDNCNAIIETESNTLITGCKNTIIPSSVTSIGEKAFYNCSGLTSVTIPNSVTSIGSSAFSGCNKLLFNKYDNAKYLGNNSNPYLYLYCSVSQSITSCEINENCKIIADHAFNNCSLLASITIPSDVTSIGEKAFYNCKGLKKTEFASVENLCKMSFGNFEANPLYYSHHLYINDKEITELIIPNSVTSIKGNVFHGCSGLTSVTIPNSVTNIEEKAFKMCDGLTSVTIGEGVTSIGYEAFYDCRGLTSVTIPNSVTSIGERAFYNVNHIVYTGSATGSPWGAILINGFVDGDFVFSDDTKTQLTIYIGDGGDVTIPSSVTSIGSRAFYNCGALTSVTIPNSVTNIGSYAFYGCNGLASVTIPNSVTSIGASAFSNCIGLTSIIVPCEKYDYFIGVITQHAAIIYGDCSFEIAANENNEDYGTVTGGGTIMKGQTIQITATPNDHYHFVKWNDDNTENPRTVQVTQDSIFTAFFAIDEHNVTASPNSATGTVIGDGVYGYGTNITLTAMPNDHYHFVKWNDGDTENPRTVKVIQDSAFTAVFAIDEHNVIVSKNLSAAGAVTGEGVYGYGTNITLTAMPNNEHYHFVKWNDGNTDNPRTIQVTQDSTFTALFTIDKYNVTISKNLSAAGVVTGDGVYEYGTNITLTATPNEGYRFKGWSDGAIGKSRELTVTKDIDIIANFVPLYTLKTLASASQGSVSGGGIYEDGEIATLVANAKPGYVFAQWADGNDENPRYVTVDGNKTYTAIFIEGEQDKYMITWKNWDGRVIKTSEVSYGEVPAFDGEKPTRPDEAGYTFTFSGWSPTIAAASQNAEYTANYIQTATEAEKTTIENEGDISITTTDNTALFTWPENASADTYTLTITRNDEVFCSLTFDGQGRLINLNFPNLRASAEGYQFTVTGLNSGTDYAYDLKAKNGAATVNEYTGEFRTSGDAATAAPEAEESIVETARYDINGRPLTAPMKGVNIVKYSDGSFEKEFVR